MKKRILCFCLCLYCIGLWAANASFKKTGNDLLFLLPQGNVKLEFCTDDMFRVRHSQGTVFAENEQWMVRKYDFTPVHYTVEDKGAAWLITTGKLISECRVGKRDKTGCRRKRYFTCQLLSRTFYDEYQRIWFVLSYSVCYRVEYGVG